MIVTGKKIYFGQICSLPKDKEFGFIRIEGIEVYFNYKYYIGEKSTLKEGTKVQFLLRVRDDDKKYAIDVEVAKSPKSTVNKSPRNTVRKPGLPLSVPASELSDSVKVEKLNRHVRQYGPILITWFRDVVTNIRSSGTMTAKNKDMLKVINDAFPKLATTKLDWPQLYRTNYETTRTTHPYISRRCRLAVIVSEKNVPILDLEPFKNALVESIYLEAIANSRDCWTILGDETGGLEEFGGKVGVKKSEMCWVAIPPDSMPPALNQMFHASGPQGIPDLTAALTNMASDPNILLFSFPFSEGVKTSGLSGVAADSHLDFWQDTLPLVLEHISNNIPNKANINIFIEQVGDLESGIGVIPPLVRELKSALNCRSSWKRLNFGPDLHVLSKNPCEHPWIGYPDALGHVSTDKERDKELSDLIHRIRTRIISTPYRQTSLNGPIRQALKETARPLSFLKFIYEISEEDIRDYVKPFFSSAIAESISSLNQADWQKLLTHMDIHAIAKQGQYASELIIEFVNINTELDKLSQAKDKFDFALAMLGTSNHIGARNIAARCIKLCKEILTTGFKPHKDRLIKFKNLQGGVRDNQFDFSHIEDDLELPSDSEFNDEWGRYLGAQAISRALRGKENDLNFASEIEEYLLNNTSNFDDLKRRWIMHAELKFEDDCYDEAMYALETQLPDAIDSDVLTMINDGYYLASLMKGCTLSGERESIFDKYSVAISSRLNEHHPSQRIAYWFIRWANQIGKNKSGVSSLCRKHITSLMDEPLFAHDAPGVILACELLDLKSRKLIDVDAENFLEMVLKNSVESTRVWVADHPPNEDDWLAPLNFNYR